MTPLTRRQADVFRCFVRLWQRDGVPPTVREMMADLGVRSPNALQQHIEALRAKGYLTEVAGRKRAMRPIGVNILIVPADNAEGDRVRNLLRPDTLDPHDWDSHEDSDDE